MNTSRVAAPGNPESRWPVFIALIAAMALQLAIPGSTPWCPLALISMELLLLVVLTIINPVRLTRSTRSARRHPRAPGSDHRRQRRLGAVLDYRIVTGQVSNNAAFSSAAGRDLLTNVIVFGIWYWRPTSAARSVAQAWTPDNPRPLPDFMFPNRQTPTRTQRLGTRFLDYLYVSLTNVVAFSPTTRCH